MELLLDLITLGGVISIGAGVYILIDEYGGDLPQERCACGEVLDGDAVACDDTSETHCRGCAGACLPCRRAMRADGAA